MTRGRAAYALAAFGFALLAAAYLMAKSSVVAADGTRCASAYRAANGSLFLTGDRTTAEVELSHASCREAGQPVMRRAYRVAAAGGVLVVVAIGYYVAAARPKAA